MVLNRAKIIQIKASVICFNFVVLRFWSSSGMKIMPFPLLWEQPNASMLTVSCLQITLAHAWRLAVSSIKHGVFISSIFVNSIF